MHGTTSSGPHGFKRRFLSVSSLTEANDSCGMARLGTSSMDVEMTLFSKGAICLSSNPISQSHMEHFPYLPDDAL